MGEILVYSGCWQETRRENKRTVDVRNLLPNIT